MGAYAWMTVTSHFTMSCKSCSDYSIIYVFPTNECLRFYAMQKYTTPLLCEFWFPEKRIVVPSLAVLPFPVHVTSEIPRMSNLQLFIITCCVLPHWCIVRTFHVAIFVVVLSFQDLGVLSALTRTRHPYCYKWTVHLVATNLGFVDWLWFLWFKKIWWGRATGHAPSPPLFSTWLGTGFGRSYSYRLLQ